MLIAAAALLLSGCADDGTDACTYDTTFAGVQVTGTSGQQPTITVGPDAAPATELGVLDLCPGDGVPLEASSIATADYVGVAQSTGAVFDASYGTGSPITFGLSQVVAGWEQGLEGMQVGGTRLLVIPPELGYGTQGSGSDIPPNETLIFVVDLIDAQ